MRKLLTLDVGTTAVKVSLFGEDLKLIKSVINEYQLLTPKSDIVEMQPEVYWENAVAGIRSVMEQTKTPPEEVVCVTCTTQGETLIPVGANKQPLHNAIVWLDSRAGNEADIIAEKFDPAAFYAKTGLPEVNAYCPVSKMLWVKNNLPDIYAKTEKLLLLEDFFILKFSGEYATDPGLMCSTGYYDIVDNRVWDDILTAFSMDASKIPPVFPCGAVVGKLLPEVAGELGLSADTVVSTSAMDQISAAIGAGNTEAGIVQESTGTCLAVVATVDKPDLSKWSPVTVHCHGIAGKYIDLTVCQTAGIILKWFRNEFCHDIVAESGEAAFERMSELAASAPPLSKGLFLFPHFTGIQAGIQAPQADERARGVFLGAGLDVGRDCFIRAIMESVGYMLRENIEMMRVEPSHVIALGGGSKSDVWCQIKANILGNKIVVMETEEIASLGAAMLGGAACGLFPDLPGAAEVFSQSKTFSPETETVAAYKRGYERYLKLYESLKPLFNPL